MGETWDTPPADRLRWIRWGLLIADRRVTCSTRRGLFGTKKVGGGGGGHEGVAVGDFGDGGDLPAEGDAEADGLLGREAEIIQAARKPVEALGVGFGGARHGAVVRVDVGFAEEDEHGAREGGFQVGDGDTGTTEAVGVGDLEIGEHIGTGVGGDDAGGARIGEEKEEPVDELRARRVTVDEVGGRGEAGGGFDVVEEAFDRGERPNTGRATRAVGREDVAVVVAVEAGEVTVAEGGDEEEEAVAGGEFAPLVAVFVAVAGLSVHHEDDRRRGCDAGGGVKIDGERRAIPCGEREDTVAGGEFFGCGSVGGRCGGNGERGGAHEEACEDVGEAGEERRGGGARGHGEECAFAGEIGEPTQRVAARRLTRVQNGRTTSDGHEDQMERRPGEGHDDRAAVDRARPVEPRRHGKSDSGVARGLSRRSRGLQSEQSRVGGRAGRGAVKEARGPGGVSKPSGGGRPAPAEVHRGQAAVQQPDRAG